MKDKKPTKKEEYSLEDYNANNVFETLEDAKEYLRENWIKGVVCPCCTQMVKRYSYKLYGSSAYALILLYQLTIKTNETWHHIKNYAEASKDRGRAHHFNDLKYWGLTEPAKTKVDGKKSSGYWKITQKGMDFVDNKIKIKEKVMQFNGKCYGFEGEDVNIIDTLGNKFNYDEIMGIS